MGFLPKKGSRKPVYKLNGHPVIEKFPGINMHKTANAFAVRIEMLDSESPTGMSEIFVHKNCVFYRGGHYAQALYDVQLIDEDYGRYRSFTDPLTGGRLVQTVPGRVSADDVVRMMQETQDYYWKQEPKIRRTDKSIAAMPKDMITTGYLARPEIDMEELEMY